MNTLEIDFDHGQIKDNQAEFIAVLRKAKTIVFFKHKDTGVCAIKLIVENFKYKRRTKEDHMFGAKGIITGSNVRHSMDISIHMIKSLIKPKTMFNFDVYRDCKTSQYHTKNRLHCDAIFLIINGMEILMDASTCEDNSARMINY